MLNISYRFVTKFFCSILLFKKLNHVSVISMILNGEFFVLCFYYVRSCKLIICNKRFNVRANTCQRKSEFHTQILILLKPSLIHVRLTSDIMDIK